MTDSDNDSIKSQRDYVTARPKVHVSTVPSSVIRNRNLKVPAFSPDDPEIWFALLEAQFVTYGITDEAIMFNNVIINLDLQYSKAVRDIILNPPSKEPYNKIKREIIKRHTASKEKKVKQLLTHEALGDRKPSQFLRHLQDLAGSEVPEEFIKTIWCNRLPNNIQTILAAQPSHNTLDELSDLADRVQEITSPCNVAATSSTSNSTSNEIAELKKMVEHLTMKLDEHTRGSQRPNNRSRSQQRRSSARQRSRSNSSYRKYPTCWYHSKFGPKANKCIQPCDFNKSGNAMGGR